jgi:transcriptional regulator with XRE-family HTH domain
MPKRIAHNPRRRPTFVREWRRYRNLTQEQLAGRLGTTKTSISRIEAGEQAYTQDFLEACAEALMCEPADLLIRDPSDPDGMWSIWDHAKPAERRQMVELAKVLLRGKAGGR